jgi:hypothetical protein
MSTKTDVNRRTMIRGAGVLPAIAILPTAALAAGTAPPDPIFAAIAAHHQASEIYSQLCLANEADAELDRINDDVEAAAEVLADTKPTTLAGAAALLRHVAQHEADGFDFSLENEDGRLISWTCFVNHNVADALASGVSS